MKNHSRAAPRVCTGLIAAAMLCAGCETTERGSEAAGPGAERAVRMDGSIDDWPSDAACVADEDFVYVRFTVIGDEFTLQNSNRTMALYLDLDSDSQTGVGEDAPAPDARGADLVVEFSPRTEEPGAGRGVAVFAVDADGTRRVVRHSDVDLSFCPTYAAPWYEVRLSRRPSPSCALAGPLSAAVEVRGMVAMLDESGRASMVSDSFAAVLPTRGSGEVLRVDVPAPSDDFRVVSWNVLKSAPAERPEAFARVLRALRPDAVLLQEWGKSSAGEIEAWFTAFVPSRSGWHAVKSEDGDVAIVARHPLAPLPGGVHAAGRDRPVRFVGAVATTPRGDVLLGSVHLKCCGSKGSPEDATRAEEASAVAEWLRGRSEMPRVRVLGGDLNLVGTRAPLDMLRAGVDADGSDLEIAEADVLGDSAMYTWRDGATEFTPGRLDYLLWSGSTVPATGAFVLDTAKLSPGALSRAGLQRPDTDASDHLPIVIDLDLGSSRDAAAEAGSGAPPR